MVRHKSTPTRSLSPTELPGREKLEGLRSLPSLSFWAFHNVELLSPGSTSSSSSPTSTAPSSNGTLLGPGTTPGEAGSGIDDMKSGNDIHRNKQLRKGKSKSDLRSKERLSGGTSPGEENVENGKRRMGDDRSETGDQLRGEDGGRTARNELAGGEKKKQKMGDEDGPLHPLSRFSEVPPLSDLQVAITKAVRKTRAADGYAHVKDIIKYIANKSWRTMRRRDGSQYTTGCAYGNSALK